MQTGNRAVPGNPRETPDETRRGGDRGVAAPDRAKLDAFLAKVVAGWGATWSASLAVAGERLGLNRARKGARDRGARQRHWDEDKEETLVDGGSRPDSPQQLGPAGGERAH